MPTESAPSSDPVDHQDLSELIRPRHHRAEIVFGVLSFALALFLLSQIDNETTWIAGRPFVRQPAFWPTVSIVGMTVFGAFELWSTTRALRSRTGSPVAPEIMLWVRAVEYLAWFMAYVWIVPVIGYLPTTMIFCALLTWRLGYRRPKTILAAVLTGIGTVIVFKTLLAVKIPGGELYEYLPHAIRNVMIQYF
jgi:hypothetical protein